MSVANQPSQNMTATRAETRQRLEREVAYIGNTGRRAFDAVVFELANSNAEVERTVTVLTGGTTNVAVDTHRVRRLATRLKAMGFSVRWTSMGHPADGMGGTIRMSRS